jgi:hypothetical protein
MPINLEVVQFIDLRKCYVRMVFPFWTTLIRSNSCHPYKHKNYNKVFSYQNEHIPYKQKKQWITDYENSNNIPC